MILIVDDSGDIRELIKRALAKDGFFPEMAANGREALRLIEAGLKPSLIFLDTNMDVMDGVEFIKQLNDRFPDLNSKIVTISADEENAAGPRIVGNIKKPLDLQALRKMARTYATHRDKANPEFLNEYQKKREH